MPRFLLPLLLVLSACDSATSSCALGQVRENGVCITPAPPSVVRLSSVGVRTDRGKRGTYVGGPVEGAPFVVRKTADDDVVFMGQTSAEFEAVDSDERVHVVDFRDLSAAGEYYVEVEGVARSNPFWIADDVYVEAFRAAMHGMYGQRCGTAVSLDWQGDTFQHGECHAADLAPYGWHDAGDYGKYTNNGSFALGMMLVAWEQFKDKLEGFELEIPERGDAVPDFLDECRFQLDWLFHMQDEETGGVHDRETTSNFDPLAMTPERSTNPRRLAPVSTTATADFAAVMARAARAFEPYDPDLSERARTAALAAWQFLQENTTILPMNMGFTGSYVSGDVDDRLWAAAEIWELTGDETALELFEAADSMVGGFPLASSWDWADLTSLGVFTYLESGREGRTSETVDRLTLRLDLVANALAQEAHEHAYGRTLGEYYEWGVNGMIARTVMNLVTAARLSERNGDEEGRRAYYLDAGAFQLDHLLGRNYFNRSFVTGVGFAPPLFPHHRPSVGDLVEAPWPGLLVGGPSRNMGGVRGFARQWFDDIDDFTSNEVAINWNAPLIYALAAFLP